MLRRTISTLLYQKSPSNFSCISIHRSKEQSTHSTAVAPGTQLKPQLARAQHALMSYSRTHTAGTVTSTVFDLRGRVAVIQDGQEPKEILQSHRDSYHQDTLLDEFERAYQDNNENPWDRFIDAPVPESKDAKRQQIHKDEFGKMVYATTTLTKTKKESKNIIPQDLQRKRRDSILLTEVQTSCFEQKGIAFWTYITLTKYFHQWSESIRLRKWSRKRPDPYSTYSSLLDCGVDGEIKKRFSDNDSDNEEDEEDEETTMDDDIQTKTLQLLTQRELASIHKETQYEKRRGPRSQRSRQRNSKIGVLDIDAFNTSTSAADDSEENVSVFDSKFEASVDFVDKIINTRRKSIISGVFNNEDPRDSLIAHMKTEVLLALHINFARINERKNEARKKKQAKMRRESLSNTVEEGGLGLPMEVEQATKVKTYDEQKKIFLDFVEASGCMPVPPSKLKSAIHAVRGVIRMKKAMKGGFMGAVRNGMSKKQKLTPTLSKIATTKPSKPPKPSKPSKPTDKKTSRRHIRRGSFQVNMGDSSMYDTTANRSRTVGSAQAASAAAAVKTHTSVIIPRQKVKLNNDARSFVVNLSQDVCTTGRIASDNSSSSTSRNDSINGSSTDSSCNISVSRSGKIIAGSSFERDSVSILSTPYNVRHTFPRFSSVSNRQLRTPTFRVVLVDDSKSYRIKLRGMLQRLFQNIVVQMCASPSEGISCITNASSDAPINIIISDQIFVGSDTTGKKMCDILARKSQRLGQTNCPMSPCILISDFIEMDAPRNVDEMFAEDTIQLEERGRAGPSALAKWATGSSNMSTAPHNNIVERCNKREITNDVIKKWFMTYVNSAPVVRRSSQSLEKKINLQSKLKPSPPKRLREGAGRRRGSASSSRGDAA